MNVLMTVIAVAPLIAGGFLLLLLRTTRRAGRPDRGAERMVTAWMVASTATALVTVACPNPPAWSRYVLVAPLLLIGFGFLVHRIRQHPEALFSPPTARRIRACRRHR